MVLPGSYTEKTLAVYMHGVLGPLAGVLGLAVGAADAGSYAEAVNAVLLAYSGVAQVSEALDLERLRGLACVEAWQLACNGLAAAYDFGAEGGTYQRSQMLAAAQSRLLAAQSAALVFDRQYVVQVTRMKAVHDPYRYVPDDERSL